MVQRNVTQKFSIHLDDVSQVEKRPSNPKCLFQRQDSNSRGPELKKMKKSRSIKHSSSDSFRVRPSRKNAVLQHQRKSPVEFETPQKPPAIKSLKFSPNYMKGTSSSEAKRENSQVSPFIPQNLRRRCSSYSKLFKPSSKTSSLRKVKTLTKTPSFKPSRVKGNKRCTAVALCSDIDVQRATCSSTLKDINFPAYLELETEGTEAKGTSAIKVCPYTYCSLNGHHRNPTPPLKTFILSKRRSLKTLKSLKLGTTKETEIEVITPINKLAKEEPDFIIMPESSLIQKKMNVLAEADTKNGYGHSNDGRSTEEDHDSEDEYTYEDDRNATASELDQITESLSSGPPNSETDPEDNLQYFFDSHLDSIGCFIGEQEMKGTEYEQALFSVIGEESISVYDNSNFEATEMEWVKEKSLIKKKFDVEVENSPTNQGRNVIVKCMSESTGMETLINHEEAISEEKDLQGTTEEENASDFTQSDGSELEFGGRHVYLEILQLSTVSKRTAQNPVSTDDAEAMDVDNSEENEHKICKSSGIKNNGSKNYPHQDPGATLTPESTALAKISEDGNPSQDNTDKACHARFQCNGLVGQQVEQYSRVHSLLDKVDLAITNVGKQNCKDTEDQAAPGTLRLAMVEDNSGKVEEAKKVVDAAELTIAEPSPKLTTIKHETFDGKFSFGKTSQQGLQNPSPTRGWTSKDKIEAIEFDDHRKFNPREPNYLPDHPEPHAEKVDLKHQEMECRKNAEEWMLDHALRKAVTKLAPARKRKVALLVEAFETVMPISKCHTIVGQCPPFLDQGRGIQACN